MSNEGKETFERGIFLVFIFVVAFAIGGVIGFVQGKKTSSRPVEENIVKVDSLVKVNDSIKIKVEQLDSIKNAKIIEVQTLDNDSTLSLFYELISK